MARYSTRNDADSAAGDYTIGVFTTLSLAAAAVVQVRVINTGAENLAAGAQETFIAIVELS